ncbi:MAG TPA: type II toxin-antitoxin system HicB family antitoxin [Allosphingosinicella sp.]|nr:type II toxin-antitoxin system HicB family antitoxin [Allosphingosinicella sp.]
MPIVYYPAIIERARRGYGVFFPDLPGCTSAGDIVAEAAINAEEALAGHLLVLEEHGDELGAPSELHAVEVDPDVDEVARILVRGREGIGLGQRDCDGRPYHSRRKACAG